MLSAARPNPPPPPERPGGAYELPPPVVSANSAKDNLTPFDFFFGSFTLAAAPSDGKDAFSARAGVGSSPSDGNAAAGGPRESNPSSFSSVCARASSSSSVVSFRPHPPSIASASVRVRLSESVFGLQDPPKTRSQRNLMNPFTRPAPTPALPPLPRAHVNDRDKITLDASPLRPPSFARRPAPRRTNPEDADPSERRRDDSRFFRFFRASSARGPANGS
jgi:hypothetical protein